MRLLQNFLWHIDPLVSCTTIVVVVVVDVEYLLLVLEIVPRLPPEQANTISKWNRIKLVFTVLVLKTSSGRRK